MAETTEKYGLRTPSQNDFFDVKDISENMEKLENALTEFDDSGTVEDIKSFPDFLTKLVTGNKLAVTIRNLKAGLQFVLHAGQIVNNCVTDNAGLPLSAAQGKALMDKYTQLYSDLNTTNNNLNKKVDSASLSSYALKSDLLIYRGDFAGDLNGASSSKIPIGIYNIGAVDTISNGPDNAQWCLFIQLPGIYCTQIMCIGGDNGVVTRRFIGDPKVWTPWT